MRRGIAGLARRPCSSTKGGAQLVSAMNAEFELQNRGPRAYQHGTISLVGEEADEYSAIQESKARAMAMLLEEAATRKPPGRNEPCSCGSGLKFKKCCGRA